MKFWVLLSPTAYTLISFNQEITAYNKWTNSKPFQVPDPSWEIEKPSKRIDYCPRLPDHDNWICGKKKDSYTSFNILEYF